jgi:hypothetical protein
MSVVKTNVLSDFPPSMKVNVQCSESDGRKRLDGVTTRLPPLRRQRLRGMTTGDNGQIAFGLID